MRETRIGHSCLLINKEIFVVGGAWSDTTEIINLQNRTWRSGPDLPKEIQYSHLVKAQPSSQYAAFLIGGKDYATFSTNIYKLLNQNYCIYS